MNNEELQKIRMCVQTFFNLYGVMPTVKELVDWLGQSYERIVPAYRDFL